MKTSDEWYTPAEIIQSLGEFDLDPASSPEATGRTVRQGISIPPKKTVWKKTGTAGYGSIRLIRIRWYSSS
ncbi:hypothetical protein JCM10512_4616 [Bacteroides reticulotermitis JCM 10512]|uniref:Uncharacterized protein n=1 Tax=Bacteroides reticulotermitis JCM 10512 TaxID=1445607 RepID=W4UZ72_9BACE|nr:hypothetical protein JCM10512_4616 [Bacteroides reticulotermitis JCM 10512]